MKVLLFIASLLVTQWAHAGILSLDMSAGQAGSLASDNGWLEDDTQAIDFYTFELTTDTLLDFSVSAPGSVGLSLYASQLLFDPGFLFSNSSDFIDFTGNTYHYLAGTNAFFPGAGDNTLAAGWLAAGWYTLAVGGNEGFDMGGFNYTLITTAGAMEVPEPASIALFLTLFTGLIMWRNTVKR